MIDLVPLQKQFPFPEYRMVWEAATYYLGGTGPLVEHGGLNLDWGVKRGGEKALREELSQWFRKNVLGEDNIEECMGVIDKYLQKEERRVAIGPDEAAENLKKASLTEQLIFVGTLRNVTAANLRKYGLSETLIRKAELAKLVGPIPGASRSGHLTGLNRGFILEGNLKPGQSIFRVEDGKVQQAMIVGDETGKPAVASADIGSTVDEEEEEHLATENPVA